MEKPILVLDMQKKVIIYKEMTELLNVTFSNLKTQNFNAFPGVTVPILSVFPALIVHSELKSVHPEFPVAFIF